MSTSTIHDLAWKGELTEKHLQDVDWLQAIDEPDPTRYSLTPLGAAVLNDHVSVVELLLRHRADVNKPSGTRTPLWLAVSKTENEKNVGPIVKILLDGGADPNVASKNDKNRAPLLNAVMRNLTPEVIRMLVDGGASIEAEDEFKQSAKKFATRKSEKIQRALFANSWRIDRYKAAGMVTTLVLFVVAWSNATPYQRRSLALAATAGAAAGAAAIFGPGQRTARPPAKSVTHKPTKAIVYTSTQPAAAIEHDGKAIVEDTNTNQSNTNIILATPDSAQTSINPIDNNAKSISEPVQFGSTIESAIGHTAKAVVENHDTSQSATNTDNDRAIPDTGLKTTSDNTQPVIDNNARSIISEPIQSGGPTDTGDNISTELSMGSSEQSAMDETAEAVAGDSDIRQSATSMAQATSEGDDNGTAQTGAIFQQFGMSGKCGDDVPPELLELMFKDTIEDFHNGINEYISKTNLNKFFPPNNRFLQDVVRKALRFKLKQDLDDPHKIDVKESIKLSLYQTVLYLDDSGSMRQGTRRNDLKDLVKRIAGIATKLLPDGEGIELRFMNAPNDPSYSRPSVEEIEHIISDLPMQGWTPMGTNLKTKILLPLVYRPLQDAKFKRPVLVCIVTDGFPEAAQGQLSLEDGEKRDSLKEAILECGKVLEYCNYDPTCVLFQISQIGEEDDARQFLESLRDDGELDDVLYCTTDRLDEKYREYNTNHQQLEQYPGRIKVKLLTSELINSASSSSLVEAYP
ncbi:hypothetical protein TWF481_006629 [Arthrobotrys musiformis]|uniref:VWFA domain-containing protein n=1 Tax=Arthrobotrys musiformis TaxID=47236 RepID=A0AAV9W928_9PEZI